MCMTCLFRSSLAGLLLAPATASAHSLFESAGQETLATLFGAALLLVFCLAYWRGLRRVWPGLPRMLTFTGATVLAAFALFGPLDHWAESSAAMHMTQHMLMMVVIAPLWVLAQPLPQLLARGSRVLRRIWRPVLLLARYPMLAASLHGVVIWAWHAPRPYRLALENPWVHVFEHACFLLTAGLFWWSVLRSAPRKAPFAFMALLFTLMHTGFLGALLTFAHSPLYGAERNLQSQQLAGLIMWVLGGLPYMAGAIWVGLRWFEQLLRRTAGQQN
jgi:putative membrane protein